MKNKLAIVCSIFSFIFLAGCAAQFTLNGTKMTVQQKSRALAFSAVLSSINNESLSELHEGPIDAILQEKMQQVLYEGWNIKSRSDLLDTLKSLEDGGHRIIFWETRERLKLLPIENLMEEVFKDTNNRDEFNRKLMAALSIGDPQRKVPAITAWDYGRYINLCRAGYICGYITEKEAWDMIFPVARYLQESYISWYEYAEDYLRGRAFWSLHQTIMNGHLHKETVARLLADRNSVWNNTPWGLSLGQGPVAQDKFLLKVKNKKEPEN